MSADGADKNFGPVSIMIPNKLNPLFGFEVMRS